MTACASDQNEDVPVYLTADQARNRFLTKPTADTVRSWMRVGVRVRIDGGTVFIALKHCVEGGRLLTTQEWIDEFLSTKAYWRGEHSAELQEKARQESNAKHKKNGKRKKKS